MPPIQRVFALLTVIVVGLVPWIQGSSESILAAASIQRSPVKVNTVLADNHDHDNDDGDNDDGDNDDGDDDDNDNDEDWSPPPPPVATPAPPPPALDLVARCLQNGDELVVDGPNGGLRVRSYQSNLSVELRRVDHASLPRPGVGEALFAAYMSASPCGGQPYNELPAEVNVGLTYTDDAVSGRDESKFALMFFDGQQWSVAPKHYTDLANNHVSSSTTRLGVYALVQQ